MNTFVCLYFGRLLWIKAYLRKEETCSWRGQVINSKHLHNIVWYSGFIRTLFFVRLCFQHLFNCWHSTVMLNLQKKPCWQTWWVSEISCILFLVFPIVELEEARHQNHNGDPKFLLPAPLSSHVAPSFSLVLTWPFGASKMWAKPVFLLLRNYTLVQKRLAFSFLDWLIVCFKF